MNIARRYRDRCTGDKEFSIFKNIYEKKNNNNNNKNPKKKGKKGEEWWFQWRHAGSRCHVAASS